MGTPRILVIIPAHNEAHSLAAVVADVRRHCDADIVVVDDGSTDDTAAIALEAGVELLQLPFNLGIGSAMQTGFIFAARGGYDVAIQVDGDGQHDAAFIPALLEPLLAGECNMAVGSRYREQGNYRGALSRKAGTALFSRVLSLMLGQKFTDATSGFRAIDRQLIEIFARDYPRDYPEVEALLQVHLARLAVREVPVEMRTRSGGRSSINLFRSAYYMVKVLLALLVGYSRRRAPQP